MTQATATTKTPAQPIKPNPTEPDVVDRIFAYLTAQGLVPPETDLKAAEKAVRQEIGAGMAYVRAKSTDPQETAAKVLALFNGRNATTIARQLGIGRATVYRIIKQPGRR